MMSRCAFGCGENGDLEYMELAKRLVRTKGLGIDQDV